LVACSIPRPLWCLQHLPLLCCIPSPQLSWVLHIPLFRRNSACYRSSSSDASLIVGMFACYAVSTVAGLCLW
jgi:hypothetical protein